MTTAIHTSALPMQFINMMIKDGKILNGDNKYFQYKWNKIAKVFEERWSFLPHYQKTTFGLLYRCLQHKSRHRPEISRFLVQSPLQLEATILASCHRPYYSQKFISDEDREEWYREKVTIIDNFATQLIWGIKIEFPEKTTGRGYDENKFKYTYIHLDDDKGRHDCAFIEENSCEDSFDGDYYTPLFHRAYVSLNGSIFPFFKQPEDHFKEYPYHKDTGYATPVINYCTISYLQKERGMKVFADGHRNRAFKYFDEEIQDWKYECFEQNERKELTYFEDSDDDDYGYGDEGDD